MHCSHIAVCLACVVKTTVPQYCHSATPYSVRWCRGACVAPWQCLERALENSRQCHAQVHRGSAWLPWWHGVLYWVNAGDVTRPGRGDGRRPVS